MTNTPSKPFDIKDNEGILAKGNEGILAKRVVISSAEDVQSILNLSSSTPSWWWEIPELSERCAALMKVMEENPEWWEKWKEKIILTPQGISLAWLNFTCGYNDLPDKNTWFHIESIYQTDIRSLVMTHEEFSKIYCFLMSAWHWAKEYLQYFFGFAEGTYWTSTSTSGEDDYLGTGFVFDFSNGQFVDAGKLTSRCIRIINRHETSSENPDQDILDGFPAGGEWTTNPELIKRYWALLELIKEVPHFRTLWEGRIEFHNDGTIQLKQ